MVSQSLILFFCFKPNFFVKNIKNNNNINHLKKYKLIPTSNDNKCGPNTQEIIEIISKYFRNYSFLFQG